MRIFTYILLIIVILLGITFACLNAEPVVINYYIGKHSLPLSLLLVLSFSTGCVLGLLVGFVMYLRQKAKTFRLNSRIKLLEKEIANLRTIPIKDQH